MRPQADRVSRPCVLSLCVHACVSQVWDNLVGRLLSVQVDRVFDYAGNSLVNPVVWSFPVEMFDTMASSVSITGVMLTTTYSHMLAAYTNEAGVQAELALELATLVNEAIDRRLQPTPRASTSINGLQTGSVHIRHFQPAALTTSTFDVTLIALPQFSGDAALPYSPAVFANYLQMALLPFVANLTATPTANGSLLYNNSALYPLLSLLVPQQSSLTMYTSAVPTAHQQSARSLAVRSLAVSRASLLPGRRAAAAAAVPTVTPLWRVSLSPTGLDQVALQWQQAGALAVPLTPDCLSVSYVLTPDVNTDPDVLAEINTDTVYTVDATNAALAVLLQNQRAAASGQAAQAVYALTLNSISVWTGGAQADFNINVHNTSDPSRPLLYTVTQSLFLLSAPGPVALTSSQQVNALTLQASFHPSLLNGLAQGALDSGVTYVLAVQPPQSSSPLRLPASLVSSISSTAASGLVTIRLTAQLANASTVGLALPAAGTSQQWAVSVFAVNSYGSTPSAVVNVTMLAAPATLRVYEVMQTDLASFTLRFFQPVNTGLTTPSYTCQYSATTVESATRSSSTLQLDPSTFAAAVPALSSAAGVLMEVVVQLPASLLPLADLSFALQVCNTVGCSELAWHDNKQQPAFVSAPYNVTVLGLSLAEPTASGAAQLHVELQWLAPQLVLPSASLLLGYSLSYSLSDGFALTGSYPSVSFVPAGLGLPLQPVNLTVLHVSSPVAGTPVVYTFSVAAVISTSDNLAMMERTDGGAPTTVQSSSSDSSAQVQATLVGTVAAGALPVLAVVSIATPTTSTSTASLNDPVLLISDGQSRLQGVADAGAPAAPSSLSITQTGANRFTASFSVDATAGSSASAAAFYSLVWYDSASVASSSAAVPLGAVVVQAAAMVEVSGVAFVPIEANSLRVNPLTNSDTHTFMFALWATSQTGAASQHVTTFATVRQYLPYDDHHDASSNTGLSIATLVLVAVQLVVFGLLWLARNRKVLQGQQHQLPSTTVHVDSPVGKAAALESALAPLQSPEPSSGAEGSPASRVRFHVQHGSAYDLEMAVMPAAANTGAPNS